jgi:TRAP-type C4-dicarboxylate transport system permease small subunit
MKIRPEDLNPRTLMHPPMHHEPVNDLQDALMRSKPHVIIEAKRRSRARFHRFLFFLLGAASAVGTFLAGIVVWDAASARWNLPTMQWTPADHWATAWPLVLVIIGGSITVVSFMAAFSRLDEKIW